MFFERKIEAMNDEEATSSGRLKVEELAKNDPKFIERAIRYLNMSC